MAKIYGTIVIDFDTDKPITEQQFKEFKRNITKAVENDWDMMLYDIAESSGFEADSIHPLILDEIGCEYDEEV